MPLHRFGSLSPPSSLVLSPDHSFGRSSNENKPTSLRPPNLRLTLMPRRDRKYFKSSCSPPLSHYFSVLLICICFRLVSCLPCLHLLPSHPSFGPSKKQSAKRPVRPKKLLLPLPKEPLTFVPASNRLPLLRLMSTPLPPLSFLSSPSPSLSSSLPLSYSLPLITSTNLTERSRRSSNRQALDP